MASYRERRAFRSRLVLATSPARHGARIVELQSGRRRGSRDDPFHGDTCDVRGPGQPKKISPLLARHPTFQRSRADHHAPGDPRRRASSRRRITGDAAIACRPGMGHARYEDLRDLEEVLAAVRTWPGISEPTKGVFYLRRKPFLHFHVKDGARWADAKIGESWGSEIPIPLNCGQRAKAKFLREVRIRYGAGADGRTKECEQPGRGWRRSR